MVEPNPFRYNQPATQRTFVGRWDLVESIVADLCQPNGDSWAVIGGRRFGKSSVLQAVKLHLHERLSQSEPHEQLTLPVIIDLKRCKPENEQHVYACIARYLHRMLRHLAVPDLDLKGTQIDSVVNMGCTSVSFFDFEDALDDLALHIEDVCGTMRLVFLLDEVEAVTRHEWSETLFNQLRALIYSGPLASTAKIVLTGAANILQIKHAGSPLLNAVKIEHLAALDNTALRELIACGGGMPHNAVEAVLVQSGGHPFVAQYLLHHLWRDGLTHVKPEDVSVMVHHLCNNRSADLQGWWEAIGDSGRWVYAALVASGDWVHESDLLEVTQGATQLLDQGLAALCYHGLVMRHSDWVHYRVAGQLFADWFRFRAEQHLSEVQSNLQHTQLPPEIRIYYVGTQTNIHGPMSGSVVSGKFEGAAAVGGGEAVDMRDSQGPLYKPQGVKQKFGPKGDSENE